jgi:hypothetical protein
MHHHRTRPPQRGENIIGQLGQATILHHERQVLARSLPEKPAHDKMHRYEGYLHNDINIGRRRPNFNETHEAK